MTGLTEQQFDLEGLRRVILRFGVATMVFTCFFYPVADDILIWFQRLTGVMLAAFGLADAFLSVIKISLAAGILAALPYLFYEILALLQKRFPAKFGTRGRVGFTTLAMALFYLGIGFCTTVTLRYGSRFLLSYEAENIEAVISVRQFVSFCMAFIFGFGIMFELPLVMMLVSRLGLVSASRMGRYRRYAVLGITVASAIVTPTPDVINLLLLAVPLYLLFEASLLGMKIIEKRRPGKKEFPSR